MFSSPQVQSAFGVSMFRSPRVPPSASVSRRAAKAFVLDSGGHHVLKATGPSPPVLVMETLHSSPDGSVVLSPEGWAWVVTGRRLIIWPLSNAPTGFGYECWELPLATSDVRQKADLVTVLPNPTGRGRPPLALAASPEGYIRFWPNIAQPEHYFEINTELQGQECNYLIPLKVNPSSPVLQFLLATTTGTLSVINLSLNSAATSSSSGPSGDAETLITYRRLAANTGFFGSLGKRLSSIILSSRSETPEPRLVRALFHKSSIYVLQGSTIRIWDVDCNGGGGVGVGESLAVEWNAEPHVRRWFMEKLWDEEPDAKDVSVHLLDLGIFGVNPVLLCASTFENWTAFAVAHVSIEEGQITKFRLLPHTFEDEAYSEAGSVASSGSRLPFRFQGTRTPTRNLANPSRLRFPSNSSSTSSSESKHSNWRLIALTENPQDPVIVAYNQQLVIVHDEEPVRLDFQEPVILGTGVFQGSFHVYSRVHGILKLQSRIAEVASSTLLNRSGVGSEMSLASSSSSFAGMPATIPVMSQTLKLLEIPLHGEDSLREAYLSYVRGEMAHAVRISQALIRSGLKLDEMVVGFSRDGILDDFPVADPRWQKVLELSSTSGGSNAAAPSQQSFPPLGLSRSFMILHQLADKIQAHDLFLMLLIETGVWDHLQSIMDLRETKLLATNQVLLDHAEKLRTAETVHRLPPEYGDLMQTAISRVVKMRAGAGRTKDLNPSGELTLEEIFYRQVSLIDQLFEALLQVQKDAVAKGDIDSVEQVRQGSQIFLSILNQMTSYRASLNVELKLSGRTDYPWTARESLRGSFVKQYDLVQSVLLPADATVGKDTLIQLTDAVLQGFRQEIAVQGQGSAEAKKTQQLFEDTRRKLIGPIACIAKAYDAAVSLAENYLDFETLVEVCEATQNRKRLHVYMNTLPGCSEFVMEWYYKKGMKGTLLDLAQLPPSAGDRPRAFEASFQNSGSAGSALMTPPAAFQAQLAAFLSDKPELRWVDELQRRQYKDASETLRKIASLERDSLQRLRNALQMTTLVTLAADDIHDDDKEFMLRFIDRQLALCQLQATCLQVDEYHPLITRVLTVQEIIDELTNREESCPTIKGFTSAFKAVELAGVAEDEERRLSYLIWSRAVEKEDWSAILKDNVGRPTEDQVANCFIGKLVCASVEEGGGILEDRRLWRFLPVSERLWEAVESEDVLNNDKVRLLVEIVFENARRRVSERSNEEVEDIHAGLQVSEEEEIRNEVAGFLGSNMGLDGSFDEDLLGSYLEKISTL